MHSHSTLAKRHCVTPKAFQGHSQIPRRPGTLLKLDELTSKPVTLMVSAFPLLDTRPKFPARPAPAQTPAGCQRKTNGRLQSAPLGASAAGPATAHVRPPRIKALGLTECAAHGTCTHDLTLCAGQARNVRCLCSHHRRDVDAWHRGWSHRCTPCTASGASARSLWGRLRCSLGQQQGRSLSNTHTLTESGSGYGNSQPEDTPLAPRGPCVKQRLVCNGCTRCVSSTAPVGCLPSQTNMMDHRPKL